MENRTRRGVAVKVRGEYACFSRPEFKVERMSYPVITPSAARGVMEAIFWKPEFRYQIREIRVLRLGAFTGILRNEISKRQEKHPLIVEDARVQRTSLVLHDVAYEIYAEIHMRPHSTDHPQKYIEQFQRYVENGRCHHTPYLGTRELAAYFEEADGAPVDPALAGTERDLGEMLFDIAFVKSNGNDGNLEFFNPSQDGPKVVRGSAVPLFFHAVLKDGVLEVPREKYLQLYQLEAGDAQSAA